MGRYYKGACYERELVKLLVSKGFAAVRVAGSGRARMEQPDIIASNCKNLYGIESKFSSTNYKTIKKKEVNSLYKFCKNFGCRAFLAFRFRRTPWKFMEIKEEVSDNVSVKKDDDLLTIRGII